MFRKELGGSSPPLVAFFSNDSNKEFRRYDTTTSGWTAMNAGYSNNYFDNISYSRRACLAYDYDRDYIYADVGGSLNGNYIQRYNVLEVVIMFG